MSQDDTCVQINEKYGYYSNGFIAQIYRFFVDFQNDPFFKTKCKKTAVFNSLQMAADSFVNILYFLIMFSLRASYLCIIIFAGNSVHI